MHVFGTVHVYFLKTVHACSSLSYIFLNLSIKPGSTQVIQSSRSLLKILGAKIVT
jgi:hypothetical protein